MLSCHPLPVGRTSSRPSGPREGRGPTGAVEDRAGPGAGSPARAGARKVAADLSPQRNCIYASFLASVTVFMRHF